MFFHFNFTNVSLNCSFTFHFRKIFESLFYKQLHWCLSTWISPLWCTAHSGTPAGSAWSMILLDNFILSLSLEGIHILSLSISFPCKPYLIQTVNSNKYLIWKNKRRKTCLHFSPFHILGYISLMTKPQSIHLLLMTCGSFPVLG